MNPTDKRAIAELDAKIAELKRQFAVKHAECMEIWRTNMRRYPLAQTNTHAVTEVLCGLQRDLKRARAQRTARYRAAQATVPRGRRCKLD